MQESAFHGKYVYKGEKVADYIKVDSREHGSGTSGMQVI
jgi:hypothetical protein